MNGESCRIMLDPAETEREITSMLEKERHIVLATCSDRRVTARTVSYVNEGVNVFFQTDKEFLKARQMLENPRVALCLGNLQIEGLAEFRGGPIEPGNAAFAGRYMEKHPRSFEMYAGMKNEVVIAVRPLLFTLWKYVNGKPCRDFLDLREKTAYREYYKY